MTKAYYIKHRKEILKKNRKYKRKHQKLLRNKARKYYWNHRSQVLKQAKKWRKNNKKLKAKRDKEYQRKNKKKIRNKQRAYEAFRIVTDPYFKLAKSLRGRIRDAIKNNAKIGSGVRDLGCSILFFKKYIESKFYGRMSWKNYGTYWHLDHIIPLWKFDLTDRKQFIKAVNYKNMQPLTVPDHRKKSAKESSERQKLLKKVS